MTDEEVRSALEKHRLGLTVEEARTVQKILGRPPTLTEAVIWGVQGSEHCSYKSSRRFLNLLPTDGTHVILGPKEDSGIVAIINEPPGQRWGIVVSHESHNHPSQVVPYEGAATGVGGCVRDVVCMGARVVGCMDSLRFGDLSTEESRSIAAEVVRGIAGYGNPLGIPNLGGDTVFDAAYNRQCLVNVVAVGLVREDEVIHSFVPPEAGVVGYDIVIVGKPTDHSGFGGAAFASVGIDQGDLEKQAGAVQEPNPFLERHLLVSTYALFDWLQREGKLAQVSFKDLGAGGVVCASVEQVAPVGKGAVIDLDKIHTSIAHLPPEVIACAETQERLCWIVHPELTEAVLRHYNEIWDLPSVAEGARASVIGKVSEGDTYQLTYHGEIVCSARSRDITSGLQYRRPTAAPSATFAEPRIVCEEGVIRVAEKQMTLQEVFRSLLQHPSHASKSPIFRHYDKNILGATLIEPGEADASVIAPLEDLPSYGVEGAHPGWEVNESDRWTGVAFACGGNGRYGRISPYLQGVNAVVEQMRNVAAVGAVPRALTDCLNYGNPELPDQLWALEQGVRGIADAARGVAIGGEAVPVISGNVSLYNASAEGPIDPTATVCCIGVLRDARMAVTMQLKQKDSTLYLLGGRRDECGGSAYYDVLEVMAGAERDALLGANVPQHDFDEVRRQVLLLADAARQGLLLSSHDISEGGLLLALFEMTLPQRKRGGTIGCQVDLDALRSTLRSDILLFSESGGFVLEVQASCGERLQTLARRYDLQLLPIGQTLHEPLLRVLRGTAMLIDTSLQELRSLWKVPLERTLGL